MLKMREMFLLVDRDVRFTDGRVAQGETTLL